MENNVKISDEVVAIIAGVAASEISGVNSMTGTIAGGIAERLGAKKTMSKGVRVDINDNNVVIDLHIIVDYGVRIPELAWAIQENVKNSVGSITGLSVEKVNINIDGVSIEKKKTKEPPLALEPEIIDGQ